MNSDMEESYLIQRLKKPVGYMNPFSFGGGFKAGGINESAMKLIDKIFSFDYMGAAEFEFGAVPKALEKIQDNKSDFIKGSFTVHWKTLRWKTKEKIEGNDKVYFICHKDQKKEVKKRIAGWAKGKNVNAYPKCGVRLNDSFDDQDFHGWLELDNGFFFFIDKEMYENVLKLFGIE